MISFMKYVTAGIVALTLVACDETSSPSFKAAPGQSVDDIARSLTRTRAIAVFLGLACRDEGIALREPNVNKALEKDIRNLQAQGYALPELTAAFRRAGRDKSLVRSSVSYLEARGAIKGNVSSACAVGKREIAEKTAVGRLLKRS